MSFFILYFGISLLTIGILIVLVITVKKLWIEYKDEVVNTFIRYQLYLVKRNSDPKFKMSTTYDDNNIHENNLTDESSSTNHHFINMLFSHPYLIILRTIITSRGIIEFNNFLQFKTGRRVYLNCDHYKHFNQIPRLKPFKKIVLVIQKVIDTYSLGTDAHLNTFAFGFDRYFFCIINPHMTQKQKNALTKQLKLIKFNIYLDFICWFFTEKILILHKIISRNNKNGKVRRKKDITRHCK